MKRTKFHDFCTIKAKYSIFSNTLMMNLLMLEPPHGLLVVIGHFETFFYETLMKP